MFRYLSLIIIILPLTVFSQIRVADMCSIGKIRQLQSQDHFVFEQTPNQNAYDVHHYDLNLVLNPKIKLIQGAVSIGLQVLEDQLDLIELDLTDNYDVNTITMDGQSLSFNHQNDILSVFLPDKKEVGDKLKLSVEYKGSPSGSSFNFDIRNGDPMIWSLSEPYGARTWWPCKDYPFDKADSARISITVPDPLIVGSNGVLKEVVKEDGWNTYVWMEKYPITTYLISVAAHPYQVAKDHFVYTPGDSMEVVHYIFPDHFESAVEDYKKTTDMLGLYSDLFGLYPFFEEKYGHAEFPWGGGMEHQTLSSMLGPYEYLIAHELAHQWWGDMITCKDFHHIWLNEGFATYSEALWAEYKYGKEAYFNYMNGNAYLGDGTIYVTDLTDRGRIFSGPLSYNKASWVLHMLRHIVGDDMFFEILREYGNGSKKYGVALTENFQQVCEVVSGLDLEQFFQQWIYDENHPVYSYEWSDQKQGNIYRLNLTIAQDQATPLFKMPIDVLVGFENGDTLIVIENELAVQDYTIELNKKPVFVELDPEGWILKEVNAQRSIINHNNNELILSLSDNGGIGFDAPNGNGNGLIYPKNGENLLYFGTAMLSIGDAFIADTDIQTGHSDFQRKEGSHLGFEIDPGYAQNGRLIYNDDGHLQSNDIEIVQNSYSYNDNTIDNCVFLEYEVINRSTSTKDDIHFGVLLDLDIGYYLENKVHFSQEKELIYQENDLFAGIKCLDNLENSQLITIRNAVDNLSEGKKLEYLKGERNDFIENEENDWALLFSTHSFILEAGKSKKINILLTASESESHLLTSSERAQEYFDLNSSLSLNANTDHKISFYPNPLNQKGNLSFFLAESANVELSLINALGEEFHRIPMDNKGPGNHNISIDLSNVPDGIYHVNLKIGKRSYSTKVIKK